MAAMAVRAVAMAAGVMASLCLPVMPVPGMAVMMSAADDRLRWARLTPRR